MVKEFLAEHPPEKDHELSDEPPEPGSRQSSISDRELVQKVREIVSREESGGDPW